MGKRIMNVELGLLPWRVLNLGYVGENEHTQIVIDCTEVLLDYPQATCSMVVKPPRGDLYPVMPTKSGNTFIWEITASDVVYAGSGQIQLTFYNGEEIIRSDIGSTKVAASLETTGDAPEPLQNWMDAAEQTAAQIAEDAAEGVVDDLADAKDEAIAAIEAKGEEVIEEIPADYTQLSEDVQNVKSAINDHTTELEMLITKTPIAPTEVTQVADLSGAAIAGSTDKYYHKVKVYLLWNGFYYMNPSNLDLRLYYFQAFNKDGEQITIYRNGSQTSVVTMGNGGYFEKVDNRTIKEYTKNGTLNWTWTFDDDVEYLGSSDNYKACIGTFSDATQLVGVTFFGASESYVAFTPIDELSYEYEYSDDLMHSTFEKLQNEYTDDEPIENSGNFVKSGGVVSSLLKDSYNLIDPEWFDWSNPSATYISLKTGIYISVTAGKVLISNCEKVLYTFYDATKTQLSRDGTSIAYAAVTIPTDTVYMTIQLNNSSGYIPSNHEVVIYYSGNEISPQDDIRPYIVHKNLQGMRGSNEIFDYYAPSGLDREIIQMAKYSAVRNMNFCNNIIRFGTFNMYNPRINYGWETAKKMLKDFAIDIVGFQEVSLVRTPNNIWTEYLKSWQFPYGVTDAPVAVASQFEVLSYTAYTTTSTDRKFMKAVIQLPRYADSVNPTLSVYDYHGIWNGGSVELRTQEIEEILAIIANDTSDFIVVVGDTNSPAPHTEWGVWQNAGFTPVHDGVGVNTTTDNPPLCLDNVFYGHGITCKSYHVVPARDYMITVGGSLVPLSDHDMVFADLQFDFDSLLGT